MPKKRFQPEEIIEKLRHAYVLLGEGRKVAEVVKALGITEVTHSRWRQEFGGMTTAQGQAPERAGAGERPAPAGGRRPHPR